MKPRKPRLFLAALAVAVILAAVFWPRRNRITITGIVTTEDVLVSSEIPGRLQRLAVVEGQTVRQGDLVAVIQPPEYAADLAFSEGQSRQAQAQLAAAEADLRSQRSQSASQTEQAEANFAAAKAQAAAAAADLENARLALDRQKSLHEKGTNSVQEFDQARTAYAAAQAKADAAAQQARAAQSAYAAARAVQDDQIHARESFRDAARAETGATAAQQDKARVRLAYTEIRSPVSGTIDVRAVRQGEVVSPGQAIVTVVDPDDLWVRLDVEETYIDRVKLGEKLTVRLPSGAEREGTVFYRRVDADYATQRDVSRTKRDIRTFEVRLRCDNRDRALAVGMTAYVSLPIPRP